MFFYFVCGGCGEKTVFRSYIQPFQRIVKCLTQMKVHECEKDKMSYTIEVSSGADPSKHQTDPKDEGGALDSNAQPDKSDPHDDSPRS